MFENNIFDEYLEEESKRVLKKLKNEEVLTQDDKLIMILKSQTNHFHHLDVELREDMQELRNDMNKNIKDLREDMDRNIKDLRGDMDKRFEQVDKRFDAVILRMDRFMVWSLGLTVSSMLFILGFVVTYFDR